MAIMIFSFIAVIMLSAGCVDAGCKSTITGYTRWPTMPIYYCLDPGYSSTEQSMITKAIGLVQAGTMYAVMFQPVSCTNHTVYKIHIQPYIANTTTIPQVSYYYPGLNLALKANQVEQVLTITNMVGMWGVDHTLFQQVGSLHYIMKYIYLSLGFLPESNRGDRASYITVTAASANPAGAYTMLTSTQCNWLLYPYDLCSITHAQPAEFAATVGTPVFSLIPPVTTTLVPLLDTLSLTDCQWAQYLYPSPLNVPCDQQSCGFLATTPTGLAANPTPTCAYY